MATKLRETERELERQRSSEVEVNQLRAEKDRLEMKIRYLNDELRETHNDYRAELAQLARQISETKHKDVTDNESYVKKIDELNTKLAQMESTSRSLKRQLEELKLDNEKLQEQVSAGATRELEVANDNKKLRSGLAEAVGKIERYKNEAEHSKEMCQEMAEQARRQRRANCEEKLSKLEDEIMNLEETLREKEKLEAYLQSQVKAKDMPKLSRRSTLLRTPSESSVEVIDPVIVEELENEKSTLLKELEEKKKGENPLRGQPSREHGKYAVEIAVLMSRKMMPPPLPKDRLRQPSPIYSNPYTVTPTRNPMAG
ncbi:hypothetical protein OSTOST_19719, partial [Ostertagia ostertagi]